MYCWDSVHSAHSAYSAMAKYHLLVSDEDIETCDGR